VTGGLRRLASRPARPRPSRCELCGEVLPAAHRHLMELTAGELRCACRACQVLFDHAAAGGGHYRLVPERRRRLNGIVLDGPGWARLGAPVRTTFLVHDSRAGQVVRFYPSPAGAVREPADQTAWELLRREHPELSEMSPDVEALLADRERGAWIVPVDDCYRLVGTIRTHWRGLTGGADVREHVTRFFDDLNGRSIAPAADSDRSPS
jgi:uncharacterized protein DUF5947